MRHFLTIENSFLIITYQTYWLGMWVLKINSQKMMSTQLMIIFHFVYTIKNYQIKKCYIKHMTIYCLIVNKDTQGLSGLIRKG